MSNQGRRTEVPQPTRIEWSTREQPNSYSLLKWVDVARTLNSAIKDYGRMHKAPPDSEPYDDDILVDVRGDGPDDAEVVFWFHAPDDDTGTLREGEAAG